MMKFWFVIAIDNSSFPENSTYTTPTITSLLLLLTGKIRFRVRVCESKNDKSFFWYISTLRSHFYRWQYNQSLITNMSSTTSSSSATTPSTPAVTKTYDHSTSWTPLGVSLMIKMPLLFAIFAKVSSSLLEYLTRIALFLYLYCILYLPRTAWKLEQQPTTLDGTDFKSVLLNISSIVFFIFPFVAFFVSQYNGFSINDKNNIYGATIAATLAFYVLAYIAPPIGWRRPHPYSDDPTNVPFTFDKNKWENERLKWVPVVW